MMKVSYQSHRLNNAMLRWVSCHAGMSVLFRQTMPMSGTSQFPRVFFAAPAVPVSQTTILETPRQENASPQPFAPASTIHRQPTGMTRPEPQPAPRLDMPPVGKAGTFSSTPEEKSATTDREWRRLETIFRKHQEQEEDENVSETDAKTPAITPPKPDVFKVPPDKKSPSRLEELSNSADLPKATAPNVAPVQRSKVERHHLDPGFILLKTNPPDLPADMAQSGKMEMPTYGLQTHNVEQVAPIHPTGRFAPRSMDESDTQPAVVTGAALGLPGEPDVDKEQPGILQKLPDAGQHVQIASRPGAIEPPASVAQRVADEGKNEPTDHPTTTISEDGRDQSAKPLKSEQAPNLLVKKREIPVLEQSPMGKANEQNHPIPALRGHAQLQRQETPGGDRPFETDLSSSSFAPLDQAEVMDQPRRQTTPLQAAWPVQRLEVPAQPETGPGSASPIFHSESPEMRITQQDVEDTQPMIATAGTGNLPETGLSEPPATASRGEPVEILSPSRPRPAQASVKRMAIVQEKLERSPDEIDRSPQTVDTAIGPLPADLWHLLGQAPPESMPSQPFAGFPITPAGQQEAPSANNLAQPAGSPSVIQRQTEPDTSPRTADQGSGTSPDAADERKTGTGPNLADLANRVYAEIRHRLATEWERSHRRL